MSASVPELPSDELTPLIARAVDLGHAGMALIDELRTEDGTGATLPESTVVRLHFVAASTFQSGLLCLWMPETSLASYGLIRGLLEVWSHLFFISEDMYKGDVRCRALRYERGASKEWSTNVRKAPAGVDCDLRRTARALRQSQIDQVWNECGCQGAHRTQGDVSATLKDMAKKSDLAWLPFAWATSSAATHAYGVDFLLNTRDDETRLVWALLSQRATWFKLLVTVYAGLSTTAATILAKGDQRINAFQVTTITLRQDNHLARIARGEFDG